MSLHNKKWCINAHMGFIEVDINFFISLQITEGHSEKVQDNLTLTKVETSDGYFIIDSNDWEEVKWIIRELKLGKILRKKKPIK